MALDLFLSIKIGITQLIANKNQRRVKIEGEGPDFKIYKGTLYKSKIGIKMELKEKNDYGK